VLLDKVEGEQVWASFVAFAGDEVASWAEHPVQSEAAGSKALVCVVRGVCAVAPVLDLELLAFNHSEEGENCNEDVLHGEHSGTAGRDDKRELLNGTPSLLLILFTTQQHYMYNMRLLKNDINRGLQ